MRALTALPRFCRLFPVVLLASMLVACGGDDDSAPVAAVATVPSTGNQTASTPSPAAPTTPAPVTSKAATLSWTAPLENTDGSVLMNLSGFKIYYGQTADALDSTIAVTNPSISTYVVENLSVGTWYFGVAAVNSLGFESPLSNIASKTIS